jgi:hypothetical protein
MHRPFAAGNLKAHGLKAARGKEKPISTHADKVLTARAFKG